MSPAPGTGGGGAAHDPALPPPAEKAASVQRMFGTIAPRYDLLNHVLSANVDRLWRRRAIDTLVRDRRPAGLFLDCCAGTMDLALELARRTGFSGRIVAADFALPMLVHGRHKLAGVPIAPTAADALRLPFRDSTFDGVFVGFGVRNLAHLDAGLRELARVLKPGGRLVILEFAVPTWEPFRSLYLFYFRRVLPLVGRIVSRHGSAYAYLPASVLAFPQPEALAARMRAAGLRNVEWQTQTCGIAALHAGEG